MKSMSIIGCGKVGKTLGKLMREKAEIRIEQVINRTEASSISAIEFIGEGVTAQNGAELRAVDFLMLTTSDDEINSAIDIALESSYIGKETVVFHCSGSQPSAILEPLRRKGARIASVHPIMSFADPATSFASFSGTYCGCEGDSEALRILEGIFENCGAISFRIDPAQKLIYHAGTVFVCNYLTALLEAGLRCYEKAGIDREVAMAMMRPIVEGTITNNYKLGSAAALTGPIARGDFSLVERQLGAVRQWDNDLAEVYGSLGLIATQLSRLQGNATEEQLSSILNTLR